MFRNGLKVYLIMLILSLLVLAGCEAKKEVRKNPDIQQLNVALQNIQSLDPAKLISAADYTLSGAIFEGLVRVNPDGTIVKALAEDWRVENNGSMYTFYLRDAWWSDGTKITAYDFEYAWERALEPDTKGLYSYLLYDIKNAENYNRSEDPQYQGKKVMVDLVAIKALNDKILVVELKEANTAFLKKLAHPVFYPLPSMEKAKSTEEFFKNENIVSNGPFNITVFSNDTLVLKRNEKYWDHDSIRLDSIKALFITEEKAWELFNNGDLDLIFSIPQKEIKKGLSEGKVKTAALFSSYYYDFNTVKKPLDDKRIRQALSYAVDRKYLVESVLQGGQIAARGILPGSKSDMTQDDSNTGVTSFNPEIAKRLLAEGGYANAEGFPDLEVLIREGKGHEYAASALKEQWEKNLGIKVSITSVKWEDMTRRLKDRDYDVALQGLSAEYADYLAFFDRFALGSGNNYTGWSSIKLNEMINRLKLDIEDSVRKEIFLEAENIILEDLPVLPIYDYTRAYAMKLWVKGLHFPPAGLPVDFKQTYLE